MFSRVCQSFPHFLMSKEYLDAQFNLAPQTYNQYTPLSIDLCTQLGTHSLHQIGYIFCVPNQIHILCTKLGTYFVHQIGYIFSLPNWVYVLCTQFGTFINNTLKQGSYLQSPIWCRDCVPNWVQQGLHPIGYSFSYTCHFFKAYWNFATRHLGHVNACNLNWPQIWSLLAICPSFDDHASY